MTAAAEAKLSERRMVADGLRLWCRTLDLGEAGRVASAVELVVRANAGEFADPGWPWVVENDLPGPLGLFQLDPDVMAGWDAGRPEHPVMDFVEALAGGRPVRRLPVLLSILDQRTRRLVLTAFHHAASGDRAVALYAFGGDPWPLVDDAAPTWRFWPSGELDALDRPTVTMRPRLKVAGVAR